jgi:hypothetical protein
MKMTNSILGRRFPAEKAVRKQFKRHFFPLRRGTESCLLTETLPLFHLKKEKITRKKVQTMNRPLLKGMEVVGKGPVDLLT